RFGEDLAAVRARIMAQGTKHMALGKSERYPEVESVVDPWIGKLGFWGYLDLRADQGVTFELLQPEVHLGYAACYAVWVVEIVIAALLAGGVMAQMATAKGLPSAKPSPGFAKIE